MNTASAKELMLTGLTQAEAQLRLSAEGPNELPRASRRTALRIVGEVLREPMLALLLAGALLYFLLGDKTEAIVLASFACFSIMITVIQEARTERVLETLRDLASPRALVVRDGEHQRIAGREVVRGDILVIEEGDRIPADATILSNNDLHVDESLLTGESFPVTKDVETDPAVYSATLAVRGGAICEVTATGPGSRLGQIGKVLGSIETEVPQLRVETRRMVRLLALVGISISILAVLLQGVLRGNWLEAALAGIALGMSMLPEELPVVLTVFMAMGAWRISKLNVLTRRAAMIETLGSATVLCTDKTGTLTENRMSISELRLADGQCFRRPENRATILPDAFLPLAELGIMASAIDPFDPMEKAFHALGAEQEGDRVSRLRGDGHQIHRLYPLEKPVLAMAQAWGAPNAAAGLTIATKGAPETIADLCGASDAQRAEIREMVEQMAADGLRVLGVAIAKWGDAPLPATQHEFDFEFVGLVGLSDPLRASVPAAIRDCSTAGIRVIMITGDHPETARTAARRAGIASDDVLTGADLAMLDADALADRITRCSVFARIMPEQKLQIVEALKRAGEIVAMTGDGVNDAPSLKAAHIGIAMGGRGTDVAREAASMVLLDDDFGSIVASIRMGRRIYDNLRKAIRFIIAVHVPIAGMALIPLLLGYPLLLGPVHIAFLEMVIDPVCSLVFEAETDEANIMKRPPRSPRQRLFSPRTMLWSLFQGTLALGLCSSLVIAGHHFGESASHIRATSFVTLILSILVLILVNRSFGASLIKAITRPNPTLLLVGAVVLSLLVMSQFWPAMTSLFAFAPLHRADWLIAGGIALCLFALLEAMKLSPARTLTMADAAR
ncbi:MAG: cation-translocating P-type ATPase [Sphingomonadaceae bacterium]